MAHTVYSSLAYLDGHFYDFYDYLKTDPEIGGNNYLPTTYIIFAVFALPLKLLGLASRSLWILYYFKFITGCFFFASGYLLYKIVLQMGEKKNTAKLAFVLWITNPFVFYSEFIFSQYDVLTVFFMLLGFYGYVRDKEKAFLFSFMVAVTLKYFALLVYIPLVLLKYKNFTKILRFSYLVILLFLVEVLAYIHLHLLMVYSVFLY